MLLSNETIEAQYSPSVELLKEQRGSVKTTRHRLTKNKCKVEGKRELETIKVADCKSIIEKLQ